MSILTLNELNNGDSKKDAMSVKEVIDFSKKYLSNQVKVVTLRDLNEKSEDYIDSSYLIIYTGTTAEEDLKYTKNPEHFINLIYDRVLDSLGNLSLYTFPFAVKQITTSPDRLEGEKAAICGEFCCVFFHWLINTNPEYIHTLDNLGQQFQLFLNLNADTEHNSKKILERYMLITNEATNANETIKTTNENDE